jgi:acyl carrier protein
MTRIRELAADQVGIDIEKTHADSRFVEDLGID